MRVIRTFFILGFLTLITLPLVAMGRNRAELRSEKRTRAAFPQLTLADWHSFPERFEAYFRDNFGFREALIHWHSVLTVKELRESPVRQVIIGGHHRLFFAAYGDGLDIRDFAGRYPPRRADLDVYLQHQLERARQYAAAGARYLVVLVPNKQTVYPEDVPAQFGPHAPGLFDAVMAQLGGRRDLEVLDLRPLLLAHRDEGLYYDTDTHWNTNGAFLAATAIMDRVRPWFPSLLSLARADYDVTETRGGAGDLATMLSMPDDFSDTNWSFRRRESHKRQVVAEMVHRIYEQPGAPRPHVLLMGDSFGAEVAELLADVFGRLHYFYSARAGYDAKVVADEKPDLVVLVLVERYLPRLADL
ncbi:MAG TPA: hypothetical protein VHB97_27380 [Polyangia bacterium]|nr:hypothetical protein [Polyangia bacterium]